MEASERWARALRRASRPRRGSLAAAGAVSVMASPRARSRAVFTSEPLRQGVGELNPQNSVAGIKRKANAPLLDEPRRLQLRRLSRAPGVEEQGAAGLEVPGVARDQSEIAAERSRRDQRVNDGRVSACRQFAPTQGCRWSRWAKYGPRSWLRCPRPTCASPLSRHRVGALFKATPLRSSPSVKTLRNSPSARGRGQEGDHPGVGARLARFRDDIRIEEIPRHRNSKLNGPRPTSRSRSIVKSSTFGPSRR